MACIRRGPGLLGDDGHSTRVAWSLSFLVPSEVTRFRALFPHRKEQDFKARGTVKFLREVGEGQRVARSHAAGAGHLSPDTTLPEGSGALELGLAGPLLRLPVVNDIPDAKRVVPTDAS